jgi:hypothetical protein
MREDDPAVNVAEAAMRGWTMTDGGLRPATCFSKNGINYLHPFVQGHTAMATRKTTARPTRATTSAAPRPTEKSPAPAKAKPVAVTSGKPSRQARSKPVKPAKTAKAPKLLRKPVRDSFTMPEADFALIATLKARALAKRRETKKSELLRAGLHALAALDAAGLIAALSQLDPVKIGRPKKPV